RNRTKEPSGWPLMGNYRIAKLHNCYRRLHNVLVAVKEWHKFLMTESADHDIESWDWGHRHESTIKKLGYTIHKLETACKFLKKLNLVDADREKALSLSYDICSPHKISAYITVLQSTVTIVKERYEKEKSEHNRLEIKNAIEKRNLSFMSKP